MVKYIEYTKVNTEHTVLEFRGGSEDVSVTNFTGENMGTTIVAVASDDENKIDALIASQPSEINCSEIEQTDFKALVKDSDQLNNIRRVVKSEIAKKYSVEDEIGMGRELVAGTLDETKKADYESHIATCIAIGSELKAAIGY